MEKIKQDQLILPELVFQEPIEKKIKNIDTPKPLRETAREILETNDKLLNKELAQKAPSPYYSTNRGLQNGFNKNLDSHHIKHANSKITIKPNYVGKWNGNQVC